MLDVRGLCSGYVKNRDVIENISFSVKRGEFLCVSGPNGCGKSTLLKSLARLLSYRGSVRFDGRELSRFTRRELALKVALLSQMESVCFPYTVRETVALGRYAYLSGFLKTPRREDREVIDASIARLGLEDVRDTLISRLSGGQLQRVFLARALSQDPDIILLDEPTNHLDLKYQLELLDFLRRWGSERGKIVIAVLHDLNLVRFFARRVIIMKDGRTLGEGSAEKVFASELPREAYGIDIKSFMLASLSKWRSGG